MLLVVDAASPQRAAQLKAVQDVLGQIGASGIPRIVVFNKIDLIEHDCIAELERLRVLHPTPPSFPRRQEAESRIFWFASKAKLRADTRR